VGFLTGDGKCCSGLSETVLYDNEDTESLFAGLYDQLNNDSDILSKVWLDLPLKTIELLITVYCTVSEMK